MQSLLGWVGKLSINIPWTMHGRESIIITLDDVFVCASQRDDQEVISMFLLKKKALF